MDDEFIQLDLTKHFNNNKILEKEYLDDWLESYKREKDCFNDLRIFI